MTTVPTQNTYRDVALGVWCSETAAQLSSQIQGRSECDVDVDVLPQCWFKLLSIVPANVLGKHFLHSWNEMTMSAQIMTNHNIMLISDKYYDSY